MTDQTGVDVNPVKVRGSAGSSEQLAGLAERAADRELLRGRSEWPLREPV